MVLEMENPLSAASPRSLRLQIEKATPGRLGIANEGFWGIGLKEGEKYLLTFWARCADGFSGHMNAGLETANGESCSRAEEIKGFSGHWKKFKTT